MGGAAKTNGAGGGGAGGKRDTQGGTSFPAFDPTSKGLKRHKFLSKVFWLRKIFFSTGQSLKDHLFFFFGNQHKKIFTSNSAINNWRKFTLRFINHYLKAISKYPPPKNLYLLKSSFHKIIFGYKSILYLIFSLIYIFQVDLVFLCCFPCLFLIFSLVYVIAFYFWAQHPTVLQSKTLVISKEGSGVAV